ncbi:serine/threonine-protein phosphatase 2A activator 1 [Panaeolus papilionaceus]|nr:serine/threonine-protein phosphatase 2A activator 1 [Panaeolus papilionaceus]
MTVPELRSVSVDQLSQLTLPVQKIKTDQDVEHWKSTRSYWDYMIFLRRLNESCVGQVLPYVAENEPQSVKRMLALLNTLDGWIDDIPPQQTPQRFGNLSFRTWGCRLEERSDDLLRCLLEPHDQAVIPYIKPYLLSAFGSFTRMDYGTGHETSFALFLLCLTLIRVFRPVVEEERQLSLSIFLRYLRLCWRLQDVYRLEPAGSHGVWGLDDYCFLPYIFGSAQLRDQSTIPVSAILHPPLPSTNLYFMVIMRIHDVKSGPFHEHSSQLHSIAAGVPNWSKVNSGLFKMYEAEVLGKRVVVQHIPIGGLLEWDYEAARSAPSFGTASTAPGDSAIIPPWEVSLRPQMGTSHPATTNQKTHSSASASIYPATTIPSARTSSEMSPPALPPITRRPKRNLHPSAQTEHDSH